MTIYQTLVRKEIEKIYPQLVINCEKTCTTNYEKYGHDLLALCIEMFLDKTIVHQLKVISDGKLENYITYMMSLQLKSSSSRFYHLYRKHTDRSRELLPDYSYHKQGIVNDFYKEPFHDEELEVVSCLKKVRKDLMPFEKMVLDRHLVNGEKYKHLSEEYNIPYYTFKLTANKIKKLMQEKCKSFL